MYEICLQITCYGVNPHGIQLDWRLQLIPRSRAITDSQNLSDSMSCDSGRCNNKSCERADCTLRRERCASAFYAIVLQKRATFESALTARVAGCLAAGGIRKALGYECGDRNDVHLPAECEYPGECLVGPWEMKFGALSVGDDEFSTMLDEENEATIAVLQRLNDIWYFGKISSIDYTCSTRVFKNLLYKFLTGRECVLQYEYFPENVSNLNKARCQVATDTAFNALAHEYIGAVVNPLLEMLTTASERISRIEASADMLASALRVVGLGARDGRGWLMPDVESSLRRRIDVMDECEEFAARVFMNDN